MNKKVKNCQLWIKINQLNKNEYKMELEIEQSGKNQIRQIPKIIKKKLNNFSNCLPNLYMLPFENTKLTRQKPNKSN